MAVFGVFGAFALFVIAELAGNSKTREATRWAFVLVLFAHGGLGPASLVGGAWETAVKVPQLIP